MTFSNCNVCGRGLVRDDELAIGMCAICANEETPVIPLETMTIGANDAVKLQRRPVVAIGYQAPDGTIVVTDVLCANFPDMTNEEMAALSWKLDEWGRSNRRSRIS